MTINTTIAFATFGAAFLLAFSIGDYFSTHGFFTIPPLSEYFHNAVIFGLGLILLCLAGLLTSVAAIDRRLHQ